VRKKRKNSLQKSPQKAIFSLDDFYWFEFEINIKEKW